MPLHWLAESGFAHPSPPERSQPYLPVGPSVRTVGWPEVSLNAELSDGGPRVLPVMVADTQAILEEYPLLRDKRYFQWADGMNMLLRELQRVLNGA